MKGSEIAIDSSEIEVNGNEKELNAGEIEVDGNEITTHVSETTLNGNEMAVDGSATTKYAFLIDIGMGWDGTQPSNPREYKLDCVNGF